MIFLYFQVLIRDGYEAYGVQYRKFGKKYKVRAKKGVILSAGVVGSPKILMLSGIGPEQHLRSHGVSGVCGLFLLQLRKFREFFVGLRGRTYRITGNIILYYISQAVRFVQNSSGNM